MDCKIVKVEQGTEEWDALRRCRLTASRVVDVMAKKDTDRYQDYKRQKTLELLGHISVEDNPEWFRHGRELEPVALSRYEYKYNVTIDHNVFLIHSKHDWMSCSPDGLVVVDGEYTQGVEMKCRKLYKNYRDAILRNKKYAAKGDLASCVEPGYRWQLQASMWITGWDHWFYTNYYQDPATGKWRLGRVAIPRDQALIDKIEMACMEFMMECYEAAGLA